MSVSSRRWANVRALVQSSQLEDHGVMSTPHARRRKPPREVKVPGVSRERPREDAEPIAVRRPS